MPGPPKGVRLWYRKPRPAQPGRSPEKGVYVILSNGRQISTGYGLDDRAAAEERLAQFIIESHEVPRRTRSIEQIPIGDILTLYLCEVVPKLSTAKKAAGRFERLAAWWGDKRLSEVTRGRCAEYTATKTPGAARRELQDLQAAITYHHKEGLHHASVRVTLPKPGDPRDRWLTRREVAHLIRVCRNTREIQEGRPTEKRPLRHLVRFILFGLYTGSRPGDVLAASFSAGPGRSVIDLDHGLFYRKPAGKAATKKRQPTTPLPRRLMGHLRRWRNLGAEYVVEFDGQAVGSIKTAFGRLVELANLPEGIVPYTLRHTCATWKMQAGEPAWKVGGFIGTSEAMILRHYGHHSPTLLRDTAEVATQNSPNHKAGIHPGMLGAERGDSFAKSMR
ncbi:MAG TPA: site-specific integrase [Caulobacteraceae bacterium]|jgi:integrase|nr:site-specific integrase [Caulobacteraceae bacterium]